MFLIAQTIHHQNTVTALVNNIATIKVTLLQTFSTTIFSFNEKQEL